MIVPHGWCQVPAADGKLFTDLLAPCWCRAATGPQLLHLPPHLLFQLLLDSAATQHKEPIHWKRPWCWERLRAWGERGNRGWDGWMASSTQWRWVWVNSRSWWWTGRPGMLLSMGLQRVRHGWATELNWTESRWSHKGHTHLCQLNAPHLAPLSCLYSKVWTC